MRSRIAALAVLSAGLLVACETPGPDRVESSNPTVSFEFEDDDELETATDQAEDYCDNFDMEPRLRDIDEDDDGDDVATFDCI